MKIMASGPITSWETDGETVSDFIFLGSKITADGDCSHEIKRHLLLGRKVMTNLERPPSNSHGDWPFLRPPERVPDVPVVSREHLPQLEKIQEVLPSRRDEAHFR